MDQLLEGDLKENVKIYSLKCSAIHASEWFIFKHWIMRNPGTEMGWEEKLEQSTHSTSDTLESVC